MTWDRAGRPLNGMLLAIYLNDHLTAATAGRELARRTAASNRGTSYGPFLDDLAGQIHADRETLLAVMKRLGIGVDRVKVAAGWAGEKFGRLKPNGRLRSYSPLSRVVELEGLSLLIQFNLELWRVLPVAGGGDARLSEFDFGELSQRAERQLADLEDHHRRAVQEGLSVTEPGQTGVSRQA